MAEIITIATRQATACLDISEEVSAVVTRSGVRSGLCHVMVLHSTAAVVVNETRDPNVGVDVLDALGSAVPDRGNWLHDRIDDNASAHIKAAILGPSELIPVDSGELVLGTWQRVILLELDGPRKRRISVQLLAGGA